MDYYRFSINVEEAFKEVVLAFLSQLAFDTFEETATGIDAFVPAKNADEALEMELNTLGQQFSFSWQKHFMYSTGKNLCSPTRHSL